MIRRPPRSTRTDNSFPTRRSSDLLGAERAVILILPELAQIFLTVIERDARLEAVLVVEGDEVGRIGEAGHREAAGRDVLRIERLVGLDEGGVGDRKSTRLNSSH